MLDEIPDTLAVVECPTSGEGSIPWGQSRASSFYSISGTPTVWFDGLLSVVGAGSTSSAYAEYMSRYNQRRAVETDVTIELFGDEIGDDTYEIQAGVCIEEGGEPKTMRIYIAEVLDYWPATPSYARDTVRQVADTVDITLGPGECDVVTVTFEFDAASMAAIDDDKIIAWAQTPNSSAPAEIFQAAIMNYPFEPSGPPNNRCERAAAVGDGTYTGATDEAAPGGESSCGDSDTAPDLWYAYRAPADGTLYVDTCGSSFDTVLSVYSDCPGTTATELACNDDSDDCGVGSTDSSLSLEVAVGETYLIRVAGNNDAHGSFVLNVSGPVDVTPPTPDPMSFSTEPYGYSDVTIRMEAAEASDLGSPDVEYQFRNVTTMTDSDWTPERLYSATDLAPNSWYTFTCRARDGAGNETAYSDEYSALTDAGQPGAPIRSDVTATSMTITPDPGDNPPPTEIIIQIASTPDPAWTGKYLGPDGEPSDTAVWLTVEDWGSVLVDGLLSQTAYCWKARARNEAGELGRWSPWGCSVTLAPVDGDVNGDGVVDLKDYGEFQYCFGMPGTGDCEAADMNEDGTVDLGDYPLFADALDAGGPE